MSVLSVCQFACIVGFIAGCSQRVESKHKTELTVLVAASTADAVSEIAEQYQRQHPNVRIRISAGPSNALAQQIIAGAPAALFLSANNRWSDALAEQQFVKSRVDLLTNSLVLIVPKENPAAIDSLSDLVDQSAIRIALAGENVPAGIYARQALETAGCYNRLVQAGAIVRGTDVRVALTYVERAEVDAGIVYRTDAKASAKVKIVAELDPQSYEPVVYPLVLLKRQNDTAAAEMFFNYLQSSSALTIFQTHGFTPSVIQH